MMLSLVPRLSSLSVQNLGWGQMFLISLDSSLVPRLPRSRMRTLKLCRCDTYSRSRRAWEWGYLDSWWCHTHWCLRQNNCPLSITRNTYIGRPALLRALVLQYILKCTSWFKQLKINIYTDGYVNIMSALVQGALNMLWYSTIVCVSIYQWGVCA